MGFASSAAFVGADVGTRSDPRGDTAGKADRSAFDLKGARAAHIRNGRVVRRAVSWKRAGPGGVALEVNTGSGQADFTVIEPRSGSAKVLDFRGRKVAGATFKRLSRTAFSLAFNLSVAGNPPKYRWRWMVSGENGVYDRLPNTGWVTHKMIHGDPND